MLGADIIEGFKRAGIPRSYKPNEPVFLENEPSTGMYLILHGEVKVMRRTLTGEQMQVAMMGAGQTMGEISLLLNQPHSATVIAKTELEASLLTNSRLDDLRREDPELALRLFEILAFTLANHIIDQNRQLDELRKKVKRMEEQFEENTSSFSYYNTKP